MIIINKHRRNGVLDILDKKQTWYFLNSGPLDAATNMAIDEALLHWHKKGDLPPVLRFYGWKKPSLTVGYFQNVTKTIDFSGVSKHNCDFVRRLTGGSAVLHDQELTYSIIVDETNPKIPKTIQEAYYVLSQGILEGYKNLGIEAYFALSNLENRNRSSVCFETPALYEMIVDGKKIAGNAQTRKYGVLLQHGSIPIQFDIHMLFDLFSYPSKRVRKRQMEQFIKKAVSINDITKEEHTYNSVSEAFLHGFQKGLHIEVESFQLSAEQWKEVNHLVQTKYGTREWNIERKLAQRSGALWQHQKNI